MWTIIVHAPEREPKQYALSDGKTSIGRASANDIVVEDFSASRHHAEIHLKPPGEILSLLDLDSTNGTYVNHKRVYGACPLRSNDVIRIGQVIFDITQPGDDQEAKKGASGTHLFTRELLLESLDQHAVLLYDVARKLNFATSLGMVNDELTTLIKQSMGVQSCRILMKDAFAKLDPAGTGALAASSIQKRSAEVAPMEMFIPVLSGDDVLALLHLKKERQGTRPFSQNDLRIAIAISHQASLTIQRLDLLEKVRKEEQIRQLFTRFVSPSEVKSLVSHYLDTGELPPLHEQKVTVMFADIADSTGMGEKMGMKNFAWLLNKFYMDSADIIFRYNGMLKYLGDGVMAIFVEAQDEAAPEHRAIKAGRELLARVKTTGHLVLNQRIILGVSINTGVAMVGYVGTRERAEFNALGDVVNVVFKMQEYARPNKIVIGPATVAATVDKYQIQRIGEVTLRGREGHMQVYEVLP
ncbi:MAG: adenylate/guanylate cyclase domain-containing protein [Chloroflexota bacterium]